MKGLGGWGGVGALWQSENAWLLTPLHARCKISANTTWSAAKLLSSLGKRCFPSSLRFRLLAPGLRVCRSELYSRRWPDHTPCDCHWLLSRLPFLLAKAVAAVQKALNLGQGLGGVCYPPKRVSQSPFSVSSDTWVTQVRICLSFSQQSCHVPGC